MSERLAMILAKVLYWFAIRQARPCSEVENIFSIYCWAEIDKFEMAK